jgi:hypothetical protein
MTPSNTAFGLAAVGVLLVAVGVLPVKPWMFLAAGLGAVGFLIAPSEPVIPGA